MSSRGWIRSFDPARFSFGPPIDSEGVEKVPFLRYGVKVYAFFTGMGYIQLALSELQADNAIDRVLQRIYCVAFESHYMTLNSRILSSLQVTILKLNISNFRKLPEISQE